MNEVLENGFAIVGNALESNFTTSLNGSSDPCLVIAIALASPLATYQRLVHFNHPYKRRTLERSIAHSLSDAMAQVPRSSVLDTESALNLVRGDSLLRFAHKVNRNEPLSQRQMAVMHDRARSHTELILATLAFISVVFRQVRQFDASATCAMHIVAKSQSLQQLATLVVAVKVVN